MKLSEVKKLLSTVDAVDFKLQNGGMVPEHFHVTEVGLITKHFIDCGGTERIEKVANFQLWNANDFEHRLKPQKLLNIIELSERKLGMGDLEVEVEYQSDTIGKYGLDFDGSTFVLTTKMTACLASDSCGIPPEKLKVKLSDLQTAEQACCTPGGGCC
ncbi:DUF6428 family protein [Lacihabitans soyangensis]|uniref:Uncharacterized protein n=1 Tax=Lacihabitans soyangensis TaxID=869394 RepID=A0AAE3H1X8_9BACT|nr:DUF6428 family protein [Lacihabitans soyangensis]MCP9762481.1 hypothetical protein [Lacihabitans soyangensis]